MRSTLTTLAVFVMASLITVSVNSQPRRTYVSGNFLLQLDDDSGVLTAIDNKGNAMIHNVKPGTHTVALLVPAIQKIREAAARAKADNAPPPAVEIESWSWGVSNPKVVVAGSNSISGGMVKMKPTKTPLVNTVQRKGEEYYKIELEDILVSSVQSSGGGSSSDRPMESISFNFAKMEVKYDLKENKK